MPETTASLHYLKTEQPFFDDVWNGVKTFEVRKNDRGFQAGDVLCLQEYDRSTDSYSGRRVTAQIGYLLDLEDFIGFTVEDGFVVMTLLGPMKYPRVEDVISGREVQPPNAPPASDSLGAETST